ncbi:1-phosphofructokinase family hexose kinase [Microbacterium sp. P04]|uniref:1-phosphofructokinase family hexose kinase n=1 Tax=Microbacterium sp. P04 TaxID=3366947 RepID=UPI0037465C84
MIVTFTANPSIDRAVELESPLQVGEVQRADASREDAGGKGVNVARAIYAAGVPVLAVVPVDEHDPFRALLARTPLAVRAVPAAGRVRANLTVTDPSGVTTKINLPGPVLDPDRARAMIAAVVSACDRAQWLVLAGSLPPGAPARFYTDIVSAVREKWGSAAPRIAVDAAGEALRSVVDEAHVDLIKPNDEELADLCGDTPDADEDAAAAAAERARTLVPDKVSSALVTLGAAGALLVSAEGVLRAAAPRVAVASTVGAGDSSLAGYLIAQTQGRSPAECLANAVAYGAAAASLPGSQAPTPDDLPPDAISVAPYLPST